MALDKSVLIRLQFRDEATAPLRAAVASAQGAFGGFASAASSAASTSSSVMGGLMGVVGKVTGAIGSFVGGAVKAGFNALTYGFRQIGDASNLAGIIVATAMAGIAASVISTAAKFERFSVAAEYLTGSSKAAGEFAHSMRDLALTTIFNIDQVAELGTRLVGNTKDVKLSASALKALLDAVAATGGGYQEAEGVVRAWIQTNSKAIASSEELNRQFANNNIPVIRALAEHVVKDLNSPLRQYIQIASGGGGVSAVTKEMSKAYESASDKLPVLQKRMEATQQRMNDLKAAGKESSATFKNAEATMMGYQQQLGKAQGAISTFNDAQGKTISTGKAAKLTVEDVMKQLQDLGDLKIPGSIMAAEITKALEEAYGGANQRLLKTFTGQLSNLGDTLKVTTFSFLGLDAEFRPRAGSLFAMLTQGITLINETLLKNRAEFEKWGQALGSNIPFVTGLVMGFIALVGGPLLKIFGSFLLTAGYFFLFGAAIAFVAQQFGLFDDLPGKLQWIWGKLQPAIQWLTTKFERFGQITDELRKKLAEHLFPVEDWDKAKSSWAGFLGQFGENYVKPKLERAAQIIQEFKDKIVFGDQAGNTDQNASWTQVFDALVTKLQDFWASIQPTLETIKAGFMIFIQFLIDVFSPIWDSLKKSWEEMQPSLQQLMPALMQVGQALLVFGAIILGIIAVIVVFVAAIVVGLVNAFAAALDTIVQFITGVVQLFGGFWELLVGLFTGNEQKIVDGLKMMGQGIINIFVGFFGTIINLVVGFVSGVINFFQSLYDALIGHSIIPEMIDGIIKAFVNLKDKAIEAVVGLVNGVKDKITGMASDALGWGKSLVTNFVDGIKKGLQSLGSFASKIADKMGLGDLFHFQHGGVVPGPIGTPVPVIAHAGERIVPRSGTDVNGEGTSNAVTVNFYGSVAMDSEERVRELAKQIVSMLGRQNELAQLGAAV